MQEASENPLLPERFPVSTPSYLPMSNCEAIGERPTSPNAFSLSDVTRLLRRYGLLAVLLTVLGTAGGFVSVGFFPPMYKARTLLEVQSPERGPWKQALENEGGGDVDLQTESQIVTSSGFLGQVLQRLELTDTPPPPAQQDIFSKLRHLLKTGAYDEVPTAILRDGLESSEVPKPLALAVRTLDARAIDRTHLMEIGCESTNPELAANFLNTLADEYIQQNYQKRIQSVQLATQWLTQKQEETKNKMLEAEQRLQEFVRNSGNLFVAHEGDRPNETLADAQLLELQGRLSAADADLIDKKARYDSIQSATPDSLASILDDPLREYQDKINELRRQEVVLTTTLTRENPKVKKIDVQIAELQSAINRTINSAKQRVTEEYETARRSRDSLKKAYEIQAARVGSQASKEAEYNALKREADSARQMYNTMVLQANQASIAGSVPVTNITVVDRSIPPKVPYKPKPIAIIGTGAAIGLAFCCGIALLREKLDNRITSPVRARQLFNLPQLGVIPSVEQTGRGLRLLQGPAPSGGEQETFLRNALVLESFRVTLAALMRDSANRRPQVILVTSPGPEEGKTTIASNLGTALAETGRRVLIFDGDFRRPRAHKVFGIANTRGLVDILSEQVPINAYPHEALGMKTAIPNLYVMPNGSRAENIAKALYSSRLRELVLRLRKDFDTVLIDAPPVLHLADARLLSEMADGVVLVLRSGVTDERTAAECLEQMQACGTAVLGTVLNDWKPRKSELEKSYYYMSPDERA